MVTLIFIIRVKMAQQNMNILVGLIVKIMNVNKKNIVNNDCY